MKKSSQLFIIIICASILSYIVDVILDHYIFKMYHNSVNANDFHSDIFSLNRPSEIWARFIVIFVIILTGIILNNYIRRFEKSEKELLESEEKYRTLFERESDAIFIYDPATTNILEANQATTNMYGYNKDELFGMSYLKFSAEVKESISTIDRIRKEDQVNVPYRLHQNKDGIIFPVEVSGYAITLDGKDLMFAVSKDISDRKKSEEELKYREKMNTMLLDALPCVAILLKPSTREIVASNKAAHDAGATPGNCCFSTWGQRKDPCPWCLAPKLWETGQSQHVVIDAIGITWDAYWMPVTDDLYLHYAFDITEKSKAEKQIKASLKEKEILLKEIHHRVKNNMQVITSLSNLQSSIMKDEDSRAQFMIFENRIRSMAFVHEMLYHSKDMASIDFEEYIQKLIKEIFKSSNIKRNNIKSITNVKDVYLGLDRAIPCGLIITELITNSLKHAFPKDKKGEIKIELKKDMKGNHFLIVNDNGIGIPEDVGLTNKKSLGFTLLKAFVKQLKGKMEVTGKKGTKVTITFPGE